MSFVEFSDFNIEALFMMISGNVAAQHCAQRIAPNACFSQMRRHCLSFLFSFTD
jgi:hypothetical protein